MNAKECEIKLQLDSAEDYEALLSRLPGRENEVIQENLFLDTPDDWLGRQRWALRLRRETVVETGAQTAWMAAKGPARRVGAALQRTDIEAPLGLAEWSRAREQAVIPAEALPGPAMDHLVQHLGLTGALQVRIAFENRRTAFRVTLASHSLALLLDRTTFSTGRVDYEIEVELPQTVDDSTIETAVQRVTQALHGLLKSHGVTARPMPHGKLYRALADQSQRSLPQR